MTIPRHAPTPPLPMAPSRQHAIGMGMVVLGGACLSLAGVLLRGIEGASGWQILFYRGASFSIVLGAALLWRHGRDLPAALRLTGARGALVALLLSVASILYVFGMLLTTVANVVFIVSTAPLMTALVARLALGEQVRAATWLAMTAALAGVGLMVADGLAEGGMGGIGCALGAAACFAVMVTTLRGARTVDMLPAVCCSGLLTAVLVLPMTGSLAISANDLVLCIVLGTVQYGGGFILITLGTRRVAAAEVSLLSLSEAVLAPIWVWAFAAERPSPLTIAGGAIVLGAVAVRAALAARRPGRPVPPEVAPSRAVS